MIDWDDSFDNSGYVNGADKLPERWAVEAEAYRFSSVAKQRALLDLPYGPDAREVFDLFLPQQAPVGTTVFVHGGYWHRLSKSYFSHFAKGCVENGWAVAVPSYPLAPHATITRITDSVTRLLCHIVESGNDELAEITNTPIVIAGHSAGGHLVSRMACDGVLPCLLYTSLSPRDS